MFGYFIIHADWHLDTKLHVIYLFIKTKCEDHLLSWYKGKWCASKLCVPFEGYFSHAFINHFGFLWCIVAFLSNLSISFSVYLTEIHFKNALIFLSLLALIFIFIEAQIGIFSLPSKSYRIRHKYLAIKYSTLFAFIYFEMLVCLWKEHANRLQHTYTHLNYLVTLTLLNFSCLFLVYLESLLSFISHKH